MRHIPERLVKPLFGILEEYELWLSKSDYTRSKKMLKKYYLDNIMDSIKKKHL